MGGAGGQEGRTARAPWVLSGAWPAQIVRPRVGAVVAARLAIACPPPPQAVFGAAPAPPPEAPPIPAVPAAIPAQVETERPRRLALRGGAWAAGPGVACRAP